MSLYEPYPETGDDQFHYETDWIETADDTQAGGGVSISNSNQEATLVGYVPWNKIRAAARHFLGFSYADSESPWALHREPPAFHPVWPMLRAHSINFAGFGQKTKEDDFGEQVLYEESPWVGPNGETYRNTRYTHAITTIRFKSFGLMRFLHDTDIDDYKDEWKRWCTFGNAPAVETLQVDGRSQLIFREGGGTGPVANTTVFPAPLAYLLAKANYSVTWTHVPADYVSSDPFAFLPDKILSILGTWNSDYFLGFKPGTMLLLGVEAEPVLFPVATNNPDTDILTGWNITGHWNWTDPPKGVPAPSPPPPPGPPPPPPVYYGHRIYPWSQDGKFYFASTSQGAELIQGKDHWEFFRHVKDV